MKRISNDKISIMFFFLPALCFVIGVCLLIWGIRETAGTRGYEKASGYLYDYTLYSEGGYDASRKTESADTYRLIYRYEVDGREYTLTTSYGTAIVPSAGNRADILYNPENPKEAVIGDPDSSGNQLIYIGLFFSLCSLVFIVPFFTGRKKGGKSRCKGKSKINLFYTTVGIVVIIISYGALAIMSNTFSLSGIARFFINSFYFPMIIPVIMIIAGIAVTLQGLSGKVPKSAGNKSKDKQNR